MVIKSHRALADAIAGKSVLHMNSLGKDSALCLAWLCQYAKPGRVVSLFFQRFTIHPDELKYLEYQKARYPQVKFIVMPEPNEIAMIATGIYQGPSRHRWLQTFEYDNFSRDHLIDEVMEAEGLEYVCDGTAGYEGMGRAQKFHGKGLLIDGIIYPLGLMKKADIVNLIRTLKIRLNPTYKYYGSTFDEISYYRMRSAMKANPAYRALVLKYFPAFIADIYRWERVNVQIAKETRQGTQGRKG